MQLAINQIFQFDYLYSGVNLISSPSIMPTKNRKRIRMKKKRDKKDAAERKQKRIQERQPIALELYNNMPIDLRTILSEYVTGMVLWEQLEAERNRPDRDYTLTKYSDSLNWNIPNGSDSMAWVRHLMWAFEGCFHLMAIHFDEDIDSCEVEPRFMRWTSGDDVVDRNAATSCLQLLLEGFSQEVRDHDCYGKYKLPPGKVFLYGVYYGQVIMSGVLKHVVQEVTDSFQFEGI